MQAWPYREKGKAALINHGKDEAADRQAAHHHGHGWGEDGWTSTEPGRRQPRLRPAVNPKHVDNIVQDHLLPPHQIRQWGLLRPDKETETEMPDTRSSLLVLHKVFPKPPVKTESPSPLARDMSLKQTHKAHKHSTKDKTCPPDQLRRHTLGIDRPVKTQAPMPQKRRDKMHTASIPHKHNPIQKTPPSDQLRGHTHGIQQPLKTEARLAIAREKKKHMKTNTTSFQTKRTTPNLGARTSSNPGTSSRPVNAHGRGNTAAIQEHKEGFGEMQAWPYREKGKAALINHGKDEAAEAAHHHGYGWGEDGWTNSPVNAHGRGNTAATQEHKEEPAAIKVVETPDEVLQRLNNLGLGVHISFEEFKRCMDQLPPDPLVNTFKKLNPTDHYHMDLRHAVYRIRSFKLLKKEAKYELCSDELNGCPMDDLLDKDEFTPDFLSKMKYFSFFEKRGVLDWYFHPDFTDLADLNDYQRLVPRDYGNGEYAFWGAYSSYFHSYKMQHEYIEYFETLLRELEWLKDCLPRKFSFFAVSKIRTRAIYQATKIATRFSHMTTHLARIGFKDCFSYMSFEATWCNGSEDLYFEIWKRVTQQKESFKDTLKEVYKLNKCPSLQESVKYAIDDDCTVMKRAFLSCTAGAGITNEVPVDKAQEMIAEAVKKLRIKPKFYDGYIRTKIEIAQPIGLITED